MDSSSNAKLLVVDEKLVALKHVKYLSVIEEWNSPERRVVSAALAAFFVNMSPWN